MIWKFVCFFFNLMGIFFSRHGKKTNHVLRAMGPGDAMKIDAKILTKCKTSLYTFFTVQCSKVSQNAKKKESFIPTGYLAREKV